MRCGRNSSARKTEVVPPTQTSFRHPTPFLSVNRAPRGAWHGAFACCWQTGDSVIPQGRGSRDQKLGPPRPHGVCVVVWCVESSGPWGWIRAEQLEDYWAPWITKKWGGGATADTKRTRNKQHLDSKTDKRRGPRHRQKGRDVVPGDALVGISLDSILRRGRCRFADLSSLAIGGTPSVGSD